MEPLETTHDVVVGDARSLSPVPDDAVELVVTSPPYPMVEMWDDVFGSLDPGVADALEAGDARRAWDLMHEALAPVWAELRRVLVDGGIAVVNVGDATRSVGDRFRVYQNHSRITDAFASLGFDPLPEILWRKPANSGAKFMGSGMVPPNAYATLEHEYLLVFRNGARREFEPGSTRRYRSAYFWEERNRWFSDVWTDVRGRRQSLDGPARERSGAYPFEVPHRLVQMFSVYDDTVLDPFWGTGTTTLAAMLAGRNSIGVEIDPALADAFPDRIEDLPARSRALLADRLEAHREHVASADGDAFDYAAENYDVAVKTAQETSIQFYEVTDVAADDDTYRVAYEPFRE